MLKIKCFNHIPPVVVIIKHFSNVLILGTFLRYAYSVLLKVPKSQKEKENLQELKVLR